MAAMQSTAVTLAHLALSSLPSRDEWKALLSLAKAHRSTLGFLPDSAFADRVRRSTLAVAYLDEEIVGYCLYDRPRGGHIKLVHVCVAEPARRHRVGQALVESIIELNADASGIVAHCRRDYAGVDRFWQSLGMTPRSERAGRAVQGSRLSIWWRPLGGLDLLEGAALAAGLPLVAYDTNVVSDLYASPNVDRPDRRASIGLLAGWLQAAITPAVSPHVDIELHRIDDEDERVRQMNRSQELVRLRSSRSPNSATLAELRSRVGSDALAADPSLDDDLCHLADALSAGASYLVTNDDNFLRVARSALAPDQAFQVVRPHELVTQMLEKLNGPSFRPRLISTPALDWRPASGLPEAVVVDAFLSHGNGEGASALTRAIRAAMAQSPQRTRVLTDEKDRLWALLSDRAEDGELVADLFRVRRGEVAGTTAFQLARHLRERAQELDTARVRVSDVSLSMVSMEALIKDGFDVGGSHPVAHVVAAALPRAKVEARQPRATGASVRDLERRYWPLILLDEDVPTYVVPIRPRYAKRLFGLHDDALWLDRKRGLGLSREHVYFSGADKALPPPEARLLWYATADTTDTLQSVVAFSRRLGRNTPPPRRSPCGTRAPRRPPPARPGARSRKGWPRYRSTFRRHCSAEESGRWRGTATRSRKAWCEAPLLSFRRVPSALFDDLVQLGGAPA